MGSKHRWIALGAGTMLAIAILAHGGQGFQPVVRSGDPLTWNHKALVDHAYGAFRYLTGEETPAWERRDMGWRDECDIGLAEQNCDAQPVSLPETKPPSRDASGATQDQTAASREASLHFSHSLKIPPQMQLLARNWKSNLSPNPVPGELPNLLQTIYYNSSAAFTVTSNAMNSAEALKQRLSQLEGRNSSLQDLRVPDFAPDAVIVKTFWETITPYSSSTRPDLHLAWQANLFHKDASPNSDGTFSPPKMLNQGSYQSLIDLDDGVQCQRKVVPLKDPSPGLSGNILVFSLGCFLNRPVVQGDFDAHVSEGAVQADITDKYCDAPAPQNCYLILVGVHIMTRETPNWLWMTFWWTSEWWDSHPGANAVQNKWDLFAANATVNNTDAVANPYLEGPSSGMNSNCLECHRHAVYRPGYGVPPRCSQYLSGIAGGASQPTGSCEPPPALTQIKPEMRDLQMPACYFAGALQTHFLWTVALHSASGGQQDPCPGTPLLRTPETALPRKP